MAFVSVGSFLSLRNKLSASSILLNPNAALEAGNIGILVIATDNLAAADGNTNDHTSVTDSVGNTWVKRREFTNGQGAAKAGATISIWSTRATTTLPPTGLITVTFSAAIAAKAFSGWKFTAPNDVEVAAVGDRADDGVDPGSIALSGLASQEYLWFRGIAGETPNTTQITPTASYTAISANQTSGGGAASNMGVRGEFRIVVATAQTSDPTWVAADHASVFLALREVAAGQTFFQSFSESASLAEALARKSTFRRAFTETKSLAETLVKRARKGFAETASLAEAFVRKTTFRRAFAEAKSLAEALATKKVFRRAFAEAMSLTETLAKRARKRFAESAALAETLTKRARTRFTEAAALAEAFVKKATFRRAFAEAAALAEAFAIKKVFRQAFAEAMSMAETLGRFRKKAFTEALSLAEGLIRKVMQRRAEALSIAETLVAARKKAFAEAASFAEALTKRVRKRFAETASLGETLTKRVLKRMAEAKSLAETLATNVVGPPTPPEIIRAAYRTIRRLIRGK